MYRQATYLSLMDAEEALGNMPCSAWLWPLRCCRDAMGCTLGCKAPEEAGWSIREDDDAVIIEALDEPARKHGNVRNQQRARVVRGL